MNCPHCHGKNVQRLAMVHAAGTTRVEASHRGHHGLNPEVTIETSGYQQSTLASYAAPPTGKSLLSPFILIAVGGTIMYDALKLRNTFFGIDWSKFWISVSLAGAGIVLIAWRLRYNAAQRQRYRSWSKSWLCYSCGTEFDPSQFTNSGQHEHKLQ